MNILIWIYYNSENNLPKSQATKTISLVYQEHMKGKAIQKTK